MADKTVQSSRIPSDRVLLRICVSFIASFMVLFGYSLLVLAALAPAPPWAAVDGSEGPSVTVGTTP